MRQLARSEKPARPPAPSGGQLLSLWVPGREAGRAGSVQVRELSPARERSLGFTHPRGWGPGKDPGTSPRAWHFSGHWALPCCHLRDRGGARGAGCRVWESAAAAFNPPLSSLRLRHARSASRARRAAVAARGSPRGRGRQQGQRRGKSPGNPAGSGANSIERITLPLGASRGAQVTSPDRQLLQEEGQPGADAWVSGERRE